MSLRENCGERKVRHQKPMREEAEQGRLKPAILFPFFQVCESTSCFSSHCPQNVFKCKKKNLAGTCTKASVFSLCILQFDFFFTGSLELWDSQRCKSRMS